ncbi:MAG: protein translocase subunit SecD, partial [bacterium]
LSFMTISRNKTYFFLILIAVLSLGAGVFDWQPERPFHLGLDLQGGTHLIYQADLSQVKDKAQAMQGVRDVIERRVNLFGVAEPIVQASGKDKLIVELAGIKDIRQAIAMIGETPYLDFREEVQTTDEEGNQQIGFQMTSLTGQQLKRAFLEFDSTSYQPIVNLEFNDEGKKIFADLTQKNVNKRLAIFLDGMPISIPVVREPILDGKAVISGDFTLEAAKQLAQRLNAGALPVPINLISEQTIGASLGSSSLEKSLKAGVIGLVLVALFMVVFYGLPGVFAVLALAIYGILVLAIIKLIPITLTLSGIAGFILSLGMAVDANVLIFERLKEEEHLKDAFSRAWPAIRDGNVSTLLTCLVLYAFTTGLIKGFAITLGIGIMVSMFSAIIITRLFLEVKEIRSTR